LSSSKVIGCTKQRFFLNKNSGCSKIIPMVQSSEELSISKQEFNIRKIRDSNSN